MASRLSGVSPSLAFEHSYDCVSCGETIAEEVCAGSEKGCGHHCNHSWSHDECCWCGRTFGADGAEGQRVIHVSWGRKGTAPVPVGDRVMVAWDEGHESLVDHDALRTLPLGKRI